MSVAAYPSIVHHWEETGSIRALPLGVIHSSKVSLEPSFLQTEQTQLVSAFLILSKYVMSSRPLNMMMVLWLTQSSKVNVFVVLGNPKLDSTPDVVSQMPNREEGSSYWTSWLRSNASQEALSLLYHSAGSCATGWPPVPPGPSLLNSFLASQSPTCTWGDSSPCAGLAICLCWMSWDSCLSISPDSPGPSENLI